MAPVTAATRARAPASCARPRAMLWQAFSHPNEAGPRRSGVPLALVVTVGEIEGQGTRMGVDDDLGLTESSGGLFRQSEQNAAVTLPLEITADTDEAKSCYLLVDQVDAYRADDLAVVNQHMGKMPRREFARVT